MSQRYLNILVTGRRLRREADRGFYEDHVMFLLQRIKSFQIGCIVMREIFHDVQRRMTIRPMRRQHELNAFTAPRRVRDATAIGAAVLSAGDRPSTPDEIETGRPIRGRNGRIQMGTGRGTDTIIDYTPTVWHTSELREAFPPMGPGTLSDEVLLHEMIHGLRQMRGLAHNIPRQFYDTEEEFIAILITNIYASETGQVMLRGEHRSFMMMTVDQQADFCNDRQNQESIRRLERQQPAMTQAIARVTCPFNPIRRVLMRDLAARARTPLAARGAAAPLQPLF